MGILSSRQHLVGNLHLGDNFFSLVNMWHILLYVASSALLTCTRGRNSDIYDKLILLAVFCLKVTGGEKMPT